MIIAQYGHNDSNSIMENEDKSFSIANNSQKDSFSSFDILLNQFKDNTSNLAENTQNADFSKEQSYVKVEQSSIMQEKPREEAVKINEEKNHSKDIEELSKQKKQEKTTNTKISSVDFQYISELNKKMNQLLEKIKNISNVTDGTLQGLSGELKTIMFQFQQFVSNIKGAEGNLSAHNGKNGSPMLDKLLEGMFHKLDNTQGLIQQLGLKIKQNLASLDGSHTGIEKNLPELKKIDQELDKTLSLLKELKGLNQNGKNILENLSSMGDRITQKNFSEVTFHVDPKQIHKKDLHDYKNSIVNTSHSSSIKASTESTASHGASSGFSGGFEQKGDNALMSQSGVSAGLGKTQFFTSSGAVNNDFSNLNMQDKVALGKEILTQIQSEMKGYIGKNQSHFSIALKPEELGEVKVIMEMKDGVIKSQIVVENEIVKDLLKQRFDEMKTMFRENGVNISELNVKTQTEHHQEQNQNEKIQDIFSSYQHSTQQIKINRVLDNVQKTNWAYEKTVDNLTANKEFIITV